MDKREIEIGLALIKDLKRRVRLYDDEGKREAKKDLRIVRTMLIENGISDCCGTEIEEFEICINGIETESVKFCSHCKEEI